MNIGEEKRFIYEMMREITEERRNLTNLYFGLKERLDDLIKLEQRGLEDLSLEGYVDIYNKLNRQFKSENLRREASHAVDMINRTVEKVEIEQQKQEEQLSNKVEKSVIPKEEIARAKERETIRETKKSGKRDGRTREIYSNTIMVLKEKGIPMSVADIKETLEDKMGIEVPRNYLSTNVLYRLKKEKKIDNPTRGFYQYKF